MTARDRVTKWPHLPAVYIASAYTLGDPVDNVNRQIDVADDLIKLGFCPIAPLLAHFHHLRKNQPWEVWMQIDMEKIRRCDAVLRLPGRSTGADLEVEFALENDIPVFYGFESLLDHFRPRARKAPHENHET